jgi:hypothetical protein
MAKIVMKNPADLRPHPLHQELYGPPKANPAYEDIRRDMQRRGFDRRRRLLITADDRIIEGITRWAAAMSLKRPEVPCEVFRPKNEDTAELEIERELIRGNLYRTKTQVMIAREQRKVLELERDLARRRMAAGTDGGPSKSADRVGKVFGESGKTVARRLKVLGAIEEAATEGDRKLADRLTELLEGKHLVKALGVLEGKPAAARKPPPVEVPRTLLDHASKAHSEFYEACAKVQSEGELEQVKSYLRQMQEALNAAKERLGRPRAKEARPAPLPQGGPADDQDSDRRVADFARRCEGRLRTRKPT